MEATSDHDLETELMNKLDEAIRGYRDIAQHIADYFPYLSVSRPIQMLLSRLPDHSCEELEILQQVANLYRRVEDEIRSYLGSARNFAQENIRAVEGVKRQKYRPEEALINFEESLENLKGSFTRVLERHREAPENLKQTLEKTDTTALVKMAKSQNPGDPTQANPWVFAKHASKTAASTMGSRVMSYITGIAAFVYGATSYVLSEQGSFAKERDVLKSDLENVQKALQMIDQILEEHKRVLEEASTRATGISAQFENIAMLQRQSRLHLAVEEIYKVSCSLKAFAIQHVP